MTGWPWCQPKTTIAIKQPKLIIQKSDGIGEDGIHCDLCDGWCYLVSACLPLLFMSEKSDFKYTYVSFQSTSCFEKLVITEPPRKIIQETFEETVSYAVKTASIEPNFSNHFQAK